MSCCNKFSIFFVFIREPGQNVRPSSFTFPESWDVVLLQMTNKSKSYWMLLSIIKIVLAANNEQIISALVPKPGVFSGVVYFEHILSQV